MSDFGRAAARAALLSTSVLTAFATLTALGVQPALAGALPAGGHYVAGEGSFAKSRGALTVDQSSATGVIDWSSFSVGKSNAVTIDNGHGATLNRVTGGDIAAIAGSLKSSGTLYLIDPEGVVVNGTGKVVAGGGFVASTSMPGASKDALGKNSGRVVDAGSIAASNVRLSGQAVAVRGSVVAMRGGHIWLTGADATSVSGSLDAHTATGGGGDIVTDGSRLSLAGTVATGKGGSWTVDPDNLKVTASAASTIDSSLNGGTNVTLKTTATGASGPGTVKPGPGDIIIAAPLSWSSNAVLTIDAYHSIYVDATAAAAGSAGIALLTDDGGSGGGLYFKGGNITFANTSESLAINGTSYTLIDSMTALQNISSHLSGNYALAGSLDGSSVTSWTPIGTSSNAAILNSGNGFSGTFEGLGNTISDLAIGTSATNRAGLFGYSSGTIRDVGLIGGSVTGNVRVGALVAVNQGSIVDSYATDTVSGTTFVGGLAGVNNGTIIGSYVDGAVTGTNDAGGLVGLNYATVNGAHAAGTVNGTNDAGGLVGENSGGIVENSYALDAVTTSGSDYEAGGLVGYNAGGLVANSYAAGAVDSTGTDDYVGGLVGWNRAGTVKNAYATGAVTGGHHSPTGGLVGLNGNGVIRTSYSTGAVSGHDLVGGFVGVDNGLITGSYWDTQTSGLGPQNGAGNVVDDPGITGLTTAQLQSGLPAGFSSSIWGESATVNGGFPYLLALASSY